MTFNKFSWLMQQMSKYFSAYFMKKGHEFEKFWKKYLNQENRQMLFVLGLSFDPRSLDCLKIIQECNVKSAIKYRIIHYDNGLAYKPHMADLLEQNKKELESIIPKNAQSMKLIRIPTDQRYTMSIDAINCIAKSDLKERSDIIIDVSAMPNAVYFPIIHKILNWINGREVRQSNGKKINFHLVVSENAKIDGLIEEISSNEATFMHRFGGVLQSESTKESIKIWIPLLGEMRKTQLQKINDMILPKETSPIFPVPSIDPYRAKKLLLSYREFLFDSMDIEPKNFIFSSEQNPFETCRKIYETARYGYDSFRPLGGCYVVLSPLSSKLLSVGCLLAAYELQSSDFQVGIAHVENQAYNFIDTVEIGKIREETTPFTLWLTGECYEE